LEAAKHTKEDDELAHHEGDGTAIEHVMEVLTEQGFEAMAAAMQTLLIEAVKIERNMFLPRRAAFAAFTHGSSRARRSVVP